MYKELCVFKGELTVEEINERVAELTGDDEPIFDPETEDWMAWVEYKDGNTIILEDSVK